MKKNEFIELCRGYLIDPDIALENELIREALIAHDEQAVKYYLETEF